jgi:hypothetical protein
MVKRYIGGLISATPPVVTFDKAPGLWNTSEHIRYQKLNAWPKEQTLAKIGTTTYDARSLGVFVHFNDLITYLGSTGVLLSILPSSGYIRYNIKTGTSTFEQITVSYVKDGSNYTQSAFSLLGQSLSYTSPTVSILYFSNDDNDSLVMDADGKGVVTRGQASVISGNWDKFQGSTEISNNLPADSTFFYPPSSFTNANNATIISFPKTSSAVWLNLTAITYRTNNYSSQAWPTAMTSTVTTGSGAANSLYTISDGVNSFIIGRHGGTTAAYCVVDLSTGIITATAMMSIVGSGVVNNTEEDAFGNQLFLVDGRVTFHAGGTFYYGGTRYWRDSTIAWYNATGMSGLGGGASTQTGMDLFGSVDTSGWVWFADWGHDDGGFFGVGNDSQLGTRPTNIKLVPNDYID